MAWLFRHPRRLVAGIHQEGSKMDSRYMLSGVTEIDRYMMNNVEYDIVVLSSTPVGSGDPSGEIHRWMPD
ncbi:MAG: hypothetical protein H0X47_10515 [Nitrospirales bacterium]|nr:hypothetical protein [Nitrospirales bacterium]